MYLSSHTKNVHSLIHRSELSSKPVELTLRARDSFVLGTALTATTWI
jgi:hypothetical protein